MKRATLYVLMVLATLPVTSRAVDWSAIEPLIAGYLWADESSAAIAWHRLQDRDDLGALTRAEFERLDGYLRRARPQFEPLEPSEDPHRFVVVLPDGRELPTQAIRPPDYRPDRAWPVILAMHGGPNRHPADAGAGAFHMADIWKQAAADAGWLIVIPAMVHVLSRGTRTEKRLPYEIMTAPQMEALMYEVARRYHVDPDRVIATGVSLGANFAIAYAAARPDRFSGILPASSEGDGREHLIRNLALVASYALQGSLDRNVRDRQGARILAEIQRRLGHDVVYREFNDRGHESFQEFYPEALEWISVRPRDAYPREVWRIPHEGIMPIAKRIHWLEVDSRHALARARIESGNRIAVTTRRARRVTLYLHDRLIDLDRPVEVLVNGVSMHSGRLNRALTVALEQRRFLRDPGRIYAAAITIDVPRSGAALEAGRSLETSIRPHPNEAALSYWERYAVQTLEDRFPALGLEGEPAALPSALGPPGERIAIRLTTIDPKGSFGAADLRPGDLLLAVGGEPFFEGYGLGALYQWLIRDLESVPHPYWVEVWRDGAVVERKIELALRPFD